MFKSYRDISKMGWGRNAEEKDITLEQINAGSLMRIADASERMAQRHTDLIRERDRLDGEVNRLNKMCDRLSRSNAALRGHLKHIKGKNNAAQKITPVMDSVKP